MKLDFVLARYSTFSNLISTLLARDVRTLHIHYIMYKSNRLDLLMT